MSNRMINVILAVLSILLVVLSTAFFLQERHLNKLKEKAKENSLTEKFRIVIEPGDKSFEKSMSQDDEEIYKKKIKKLETKISAMQKLQDDLEMTLNEYDERDDAAATKQPESSTVLQVSYVDNFKGFLEEYNYPPGTSKKLNDLYIERDNAFKKYFTDINSAQSKNVKLDPAEFTKRDNEIRTEFNNKLVELLSEEGVAALKEYEKTGTERHFIDDLQIMLGDDKLEKEKAKELIALMYNKSQAIQEEQRKNAPSYNFNGEQPDEETMARIRKESFERGLERTKEIYEGYLSCAEGFLSESQMMKFEGLVNSRTTTLMTNNFYIDSSEKEVNN